MEVQREMRRVDRDSFREEHRELIEPRTDHSKIAAPKHPVMEDEQGHAAIGGATNHGARKVDRRRYMSDGSRIGELQAVERGRIVVDFGGAQLCVEKLYDRGQACHLSGARLCARRRESTCEHLCLK